MLACSIWGCVTISYYVLSPNSCFICCVLAFQYMTSNDIPNQYEPLMFSLFSRSHQPDIEFDGDGGVRFSNPLYERDEQRPELKAVPTSEINSNYTEPASGREPVAEVSEVDLKVDSSAWGHVFCDRSCGSVSLKCWFLGPKTCILWQRPGRLIFKSCWGYVFAGHWMTISNFLFAIFFWYLTTSLSILGGDCTEDWDQKTCTNERYSYQPEGVA